MPKAGSGLSNIVTTATYPATCPIYSYCNVPTSITDGEGRTTSFHYHPTNGELQIIRYPNVAGYEPNTRLSWFEYYARYKNDQGVMVQAPMPVRRPWRITRCSYTDVHCDEGIGDLQQVTTFPSSSTPNNVQPTQVTLQGLDTSVSATTAFTWTNAGDLATVDGPLPGNADRTLYRYDAARQLIGVVGPDVDGAGPLGHSATQTAYNPDGTVSAVRQGRVANYTDAAWAGFQTLNRTGHDYDSRRNLVRTTLIGGDNDVYGVEQFSYYADGMLQCATRRMNPASWSGSTGACTATSTSWYGPDRIVQYLYSPGNLVSQISTAGMANRFTYDASGQLSRFENDEGYYNSFDYDGFDRLYRKYYAAASGGGANPNDYEQFGYDKNSNVTSVRRRNGQTFATTYDALNRPTLISGPGFPAIAYAYDNANRLLTATQSGHTLSYQWDALSRVTQEAGPLGAFNFQYDAASRRTRITWPDGYYAQYDYDLYDRVTRVRENGAASGAGVLATYAYNELGARTSVTRGNGVTSGYDYDEVGRLISLSHNLTGTAQDLNLGFDYNPAGQIIARSLSNSAYATPSSAQSSVYQVNGRDQITSINGVNFAWDTNGNLTSDGTRAHGYDLANRLTTSGGAAYAYDPQSRLYREAGTGDLRFGYAGDQAAGAYNASGGVVERYVPGARLDEIVTVYQGSGTTNRQWLLGDERGSVIALLNASGAAASINTYDAFGVPGSTNTGRFQYTGQMWLPQAGVYHYRARAYDPRLGRFMQTDPIGLAGGTNLYGYVGNDPLNWTDPFGLQRRRENCVKETPYAQCDWVEDVEVIGSPNRDRYPDFDDGLRGPFGERDRDRTGGRGRGRDTRSTPPLAPEEICRIATERSRRSEGEITGYYRTPQRWSNVESLEFEYARSVARERTANGLTPFGHPVAGYVGGLALGRYIPPLAAVTGGWSALMQWEAEDAGSRAAAYRDRIDQIRACGQ